MQSSLPPPASNVGPQPSGKCGFIERTCSKIQDGLSGVFLACFEVEAVKFKEQNTDNESGPLISIYEGMIADNTGCIQRGHCDDVGTVGVRMMLARAG